MSNTLQNINEIAPVSAEQNGSAGKDPVQKEYLHGKGLLERNETGAAAVALHNALIGFEENNNENGIANASNQLGNVCMVRSDYEKAIKHFSRAEDICRKLGDPMSVLSLSWQIIEAYNKNGEYDKAVVRCLDVLDYYQANNNPKGSVEILEKMAEIYVGSGDNSKAADAFRTIASIHKNFKHEKIAAGYLEKAEEVESRS